MVCCPICLCLSVFWNVLQAYVVPVLSLALCFCIVCLSYKVYMSSIYASFLSANVPPVKAVSPCITLATLHLNGKTGIPWFKIRLEFGILSTSSIIEETDAIVLSKHGVFKRAYI